MKGKKKTNAMRLLDASGIEYEMHSYEIEDGKIDGVSVAKKINRESSEVYKTLVLEGAKGIYIAVLPVDLEVDLKRFATVVGEKKIAPININKIQTTTGYIRGGCSPIGMVKKYRTIINDTVIELERVIVSAGLIGSQIELKPEDLIKMTDAEVENIISK